MKVSMYTLSTCPWCRKAKKWFTDHNIPFEFTDYDLCDEATQAKITGEMDAEGVHGFPCVRIGDTVIEGYRPDLYARLTGVENDSK